MADRSPGYSRIGHLQILARQPNKGKYIALLPTPRGTASLCDTANRRLPAKNQVDQTALERAALMNSDISWRYLRRRNSDARTCPNTNV